MVGAKMTANELADELENTYPFVGVMEITATMLRQQQTEIDTYKSQNDSQIDTYRYKELTEEKNYEVIFDGEKYTTKLVEPKVKELTDEEIYEVWHDLYERWEEEDTLKFARAILRKAQEK